MKHWTNEDFENYLFKGENSLSGDKLTHLRQCEMCKNELEEQVSAHQILKKIKPIEVGYNLFDNIKERLQPQQFGFFLDSLFIPSLIMLFIIGLFLFAENTRSFQSVPVDKQLTTENKQVDNTVSRKDISYYLNKPLNKILYFSKKYNNEMLTSVIILLVFFFYNTLDKYLKRRLL